MIVSWIWADITCIYHLHLTPWEVFVQLLSANCIFLSVHYFGWCVRANWSRQSHTVHMVLVQWAPHQPLGYLWWKVVYSTPASSRWEHFVAVVYILWPFSLITAIFMHSFFFTSLIIKTTESSLKDRHFNVFYFFLMSPWTWKYVY